MRLMRLCLQHSLPCTQQHSQPAHCACMLHAHDHDDSMIKQAMHDHDH
jgi:hypothetical protein